MKKPIHGSKILVLGVAYKNDIDDYRESPALKVIEGLLHQEAVVEYYDPYVESFKYKSIQMESLKELAPKVVSSYDLVAITTSHSNVDYQLVIDHATYVFDTKNVTKHCNRKNKVEVL
jgi:UDP-N-acetyl-D-glucosamine dehydrogenase